MRPTASAPLPTSDVSVAVTDGQSQVTAGSRVTYTITVTQNDERSTEVVVDSAPEKLTDVTWKCLDWWARG